MVDVSKLSAESRAELAKLFEDILADVEAQDHLPIPQNVETPTMTVRERDAGALSDADTIITALMAGGHGDYSKYRNEIADLWDGDYGLWNGNDDCTTDLGDPNLQDIKLIQEDHYDQHMDDDEKPSWDDMICSVGDYVFFA